jgi:hypothetical protein
VNKNLVRISALIISLIMIFSLCSCNTNQSDDDQEEIKYAEAIPQNKEEILDRLNEVIAAAKSAKPAISYSLDQGAKGADCENKYVKASFKTVADKITAQKFSQSTKYGESTKDVFPLMGSDNPGALALNDIRSAIITDNKKDTTYTILIKIYPETNPTQTSGVYGKLFKVDSHTDILKNFESVSNLMTANSYDAEYGTGTVKAIIDKATGHITKLELHRDVAITTQITGQGTLASVGTVQLKFNYNSTANYSLNWDNPDTDIVET